MPSYFPEEPAPALTGISGSGQRERMDLNASTIDWNVTTMDQNLFRIDLNVTTGRSLFTWVDFLSADYDWLTLDLRIYYALRVIQTIYYPCLAIVGVPANLVTIVILYRGKCGLSECVTGYLMAMAVADLLVIILDLILRHIPILYQEHFYFLRDIPLCDIHAVLLHAATDCSVWFTVTFTFDRLVAICCQKLKSKYCLKKTAYVVLGTVTLLSCLKNIFWYFTLTDRYWLINYPYFCEITGHVLFSHTWTAIEFLHYILTPCVPFFLILLLNGFTVRHILVTSRARKRLRAQRSVGTPRNSEIESRRKSIILLFVISGNFILLWSLFMVFSVWNKMYWLGFRSVYLPFFVQEIGFMFQLLSCCTNTCIYVVTQTKFREKLKNVVKHPFNLIIKFMK
ncbi:probable G-protein coupled receptor 139 [Heterodontus francisci]|uniref:probable G-protein coupled receptor 139 n=1 Tax=Heterodontus francisci TaxID=7792 RepID=UPI00355C81E1